MTAKLAPPFLPLPIYWHLPQLYANQAPMYPSPSIIYPSHPYLALRDALFTELRKTKVHMCGGPVGGPRVAIAAICRPLVPQ